MSRSKKILELALENFKILSDETDLESVTNSSCIAIDDMPIVFVDDNGDILAPEFNTKVLEAPQDLPSESVLTESNTNVNLDSFPDRVDTGSGIRNSHVLVTYLSQNVNIIKHTIELQDNYIPAPLETCQSSKNLEDQSSSGDEIDMIPKTSLIQDHSQDTTTVQDGLLEPVTTLSAEKPKNKPLVPYSENESDYTDSDYSLGESEKKRIKRRKRCEVNESKWADRCNAKKREKGQRYFGRKKKDGKWDNKIVRNSRKIKARCSCSSKNSVLKCSKISDESRKQIFDAFWLLNWGEKKIYVDGLVKMMPTIRPRDRKDPSSSKRSYSMYYYLKVNDELFRVCKTMFLNTLDIGKTALWNWKHCSKENFATARKINQSTTEIAASKKIRKNPFQNEVDSLKIFFGSLPKMESHYCRKETSKYYLLPEWTSKKALYDYYVSDWCSSNNIRPMSIAKFNNTLESEKISLFHPKKDACEKCMSFKLGFVPKDEYKLHITRKEEARAEKDNDKTQENNNIVLAVDVQALLSAPKSNVSALYYKSKLNVHNFCAFNLKTKEGYCFLWNETEGGVSAEEFASVLAHLLINKVLTIMPTDIMEKIIIYSDGCAAQNRNVTVSNALINLAMLKNIIIEQKYLEVGHTQMEVDSMHASIEKKLRNKIINVPAEYIGICRSARKNPKPYNIEYLEHSFFKSFDDVKFLKSIRPGKMKGDPKVNDIRALQYQPDGSVFYKLMFAEEWKLLPQRRELLQSKEFDHLPILHSSRLPLALRKFQDLQDLKTTIPSDYHSYYDNIPHK